MVGKKNKKETNLIYYWAVPTIILGIVWQILWMVPLARQHADNLGLWPFVVGASAISLASCFMLAPRYKWLFLFVIGGVILFFILTCLFYAFVSFAVNYTF